MNRLVTTSLQTCNNLCILTRVRYTRTFVTYDQCSRLLSLFSTWQLCEPFSRQKIYFLQLALWLHLILMFLLGHNCLSMPIPLGTFETAVFIWGFFASWLARTCITNMRNAKTFKYFSSHGLNVYFLFFDFIFVANLAPKAFLDKPDRVWERDCYVAC